MQNAKMHVHHFKCPIETSKTVVICDICMFRQMNKNVF